MLNTQCPCFNVNFSKIKSPYNSKSRSLPWIEKLLNSLLVTTQSMLLPVSLLSRKG